MDRRPPSSLDYETLLHELALKNWRQSVLQQDFPRALSNAGQLARSRDRFWRWQGSLDLVNGGALVGELDQPNSDSDLEVVIAAESTGQGLVTIRNAGSVLRSNTITVGDEGPGIPPGEEQRIFEPFHRSTPSSDGAGLGLSLVESIVRQHKGSIAVSRSPTGGARFTIILPRPQPPSA